MRRLALSILCLTAMSVPALAQDVAFDVIEDWEQGYRATVTVNNEGDAPAVGWQLSFALDHPVTEAYGVELSKQGERLSFSPEKWSSRILPGRKVTFMIKGEPGDVMARPTDIRLVLERSNGREDVTTLDVASAPEPVEVEAEAAAQAEPEPESVVVTRTVTGDLQAEAAFRTREVWENGFTGEIVIVNEGQAPITPWQVTFSMDAKITEIWDGTILSQSGDRHVIGPVDWNGTIAPGSFVTFGFNADGVYESPPEILVVEQP